MNVEATEKAEGRKNIPILNKRKSFENNLDDIWFNNVFLKNLSNCLTNLRFCYKRLWI